MSKRVSLWVLLAVSASSCLSAPRYRGPKSDHFDGTKFFTPGAPLPHGGVSDLLKWKLHGTAGAWQAYRDEPLGPPPPERVGAGEMRVTFINHATTLLQLDGINVITDPIYADRASPFSFAGPHRVRPPGIAFDDLPPIDAIVISHNHYDHLDVATLRRLQLKNPAVRIFAGLGNQAFLEGEGLKNVTQLDWWQEMSLGAVKLTSVPTQHFSNRGLNDGQGTLWSGYVLEGSKGRAYFAGDTGYGPHFKLVGEKLGPFRLAVLPIGAYLPEWFMNPIHMTPAQALDAMHDLNAAIAVPMHYGTFPLADDGETQAVGQLRLLLDENRTDVWVLGFGEGRLLP